tara:strand:- start:3968 stop:5227 length:1260 start_codon:yes stop_codon:yes gene_type:complete
MSDPSIYSTIKACRVCGNPNLIDVLDLGDHYLSGIFPTEEEKKFVPKVPLKLVKCDGDGCCELVQLSVSVKPELMYGNNYGYRSGLNQSMVHHLQSKVLKIEEKMDLCESDIIIDIGSNDGTTLKSYSKGKLIGVDPTGKKFKTYYPDHIELIDDFFPCPQLKNILKGGKAKVITSFSMFYDLESPIEFANCIRDHLSNDGIWVFEQSYLPFMIDTISFDTVCHEHLEYYDINSINYICKSAGLKIIDIEFNSVNGGSVSITAAKNESKYEQWHSLKEHLDKEAAYRSKQSFDDFREKIQTAKEKMTNFLKDAVIKGEKVLGIGASTKGNTLLQYFEIDEQLISEIGEVNLEKVGNFTPGSNIKIRSEESVLSKRPDYLVVLPWHFSEFFKNNPKFLEEKLVFPLPEFTIYTRREEKSQ